MRVVKDKQYSVSILDFNIGEKSHSYLTLKP